MSALALQDHDMVFASPEPQSDADRASYREQAALSWLVVKRLSRMLDMPDSDFQTQHLFSALIVSADRTLPVKSILSAIPFTGFQSGPQDILNAMANLGFAVSQGRVMRSSQEPQDSAILVLSKQGLRVLVKLPRDSGILVHDGLSEPDWIPSDDNRFARCRCWHFHRKQDATTEDQAADQPERAKWLRQLLSRFSPLGGVAIALSLFLSVTGILFPLTIAFFFGQVISQSSQTALPSFTIALLGIILFDYLFSSQRSRMVAWAAGRIEYLVNVTSFKRILFLPPFLSERASPTHQAARLRSFESVRSFLSNPAFGSILDLPVAFAALIAVLLIAPGAAPIVGGAVAGFVFLFAIFWLKIRSGTDKAAEAATELQRIVIETFEKLDLIRTSGMQSIWSERIARKVDRDQNAQMKLRLVGLLGDVSANALFMITVVALMAKGADMVWQGELAPSALLALTILTLRILTPFNVLCRSVHRVEQIRRSFGQIDALMNLQEEHTRTAKTASFEKLFGHVSLVNLGFRTSDTRPVFAGLDLEISSGEVIGIFGANGSGKSTLLKMIMGMVDISLGAIRIDGVDLRQIPLQDLRHRISYIPQRPRLFPGSLRQNLIQANPMADEQQLLSALKMAGLSEHINALPDKLDYSFEEDVFSDSFRFRFMMARALLINSKLMLIDEMPNALMDREIGKLMHRLLENHGTEKTILFVSHRLDFLEQADKVIALRYGKAPIVRPADTFREALS